jgi:diacylglycerol kinase family enzyme
LRTREAATAAAFAVGVAQESLAAAAPVGVLSAAVAASRVRNGAHYPADVIAGVGLGAAASLLVRRWWPVRPREAARAAPADAEVPALPDGTGLVLVANAGSGSLKDSTEALEELAAALPGMSIIEVGPQQDLAAELSSAARCARVLGVAGGDGTVQAAAAVALERALPLAVFPGGTLNHFAGDLGVTGVADLVGAVQCGQGVRVDVGSADGDVFINTASIGTYPDMVAERERLESRLGKWPALAVAALRVLRHGTPLHVTVDGRARRVWLLFAGTSSYEPLGLGASWRPDLAAGRLDLRMLVADRRLARTRLVLALATNQVARCRVLETWQAAQVVLGGEVRLARDGEVEDGLRQGVTLSVAPTALVVLRPEGATRG